MPALSSWSPPRRLPGETQDAYKLRWQGARAEYDAAMIARKAEIATEKAERLKRAKTCQICGRPIMAEQGLIAHHGYVRPLEGWQSDSCEGARELPYEESRTALGLHIDELRQGLRTTVAVLDTFNNSPDSGVRVTWNVRVGRMMTEHSCTVTPQGFDAWAQSEQGALARRCGAPQSYAEARKRVVQRLTQDITDLQRQISHQAERFNAWKAPR